MKRCRRRNRIAGWVNAAARAARSAGRDVALTLSDPFCVERHRDEFLDLVRNEVNIVFANEAEIKSLYQVETFGEALQAVKQDCGLVALTRSAAGCVIADGDDVRVVDAVNATSRPALRAARAALRKASLASGGSHR